MADSLYKANLFDSAVKEYSFYINHQNTSKRDILLGNAWLRKGTGLSMLEKFDDALPCYFSALKIFEELNISERINTTYKNIGFIYSVKENYFVAESYYRKAYSGFKLSRDSVKLPALLNDLSQISNNKKDYTGAVSLLSEAITNYESAMTKKIKWTIFLNLAVNYQKINTDSSLKNYLKAEQIANSENDTSLLLTTYINMADLYRQQRLFEGSLIYLNKSLDFIEKFGYGNTDDIITTYENLSEVFHLLNNNEMAYRYLAKHRFLKDSIYNISQSKIAAELSEKYESDKKDEKIRTQEIENKLKNRNLLLSLGGLGFVAALAIISFINYQRKQKANKLLQAQNIRIENLNKELDTSNQVKTKLFSVISHDLRSPISSLYAYLQLKNNSPDKKDIALINQTEQLLETLEDLLIWSKSQLHQFSPSIEPINLFDLSNNITSLLENTARTKNIEVTNTISPDLIIASDLNMLTIIIRNLLSNAVRYALPGTHIKIEAQKNSDITIIISNDTDSENTTLLNTSEESKITSNKSGLGTMLVKEFVTKLNGNFSFSLNQNRVTATVTLPKL